PAYAPSKDNNKEKGRIKSNDVFILFLLTVISINKGKLIENVISETNHVGLVAGHTLFSILLYKRVRAIACTTASIIIKDFGN
ncbi:hypothetical protein, partial [Pseudoalteromonas sp. 19-MNA-CIBAN-0066]|uniref:hypothetical protein n=1 Tax=Pseudoalteromonas sp. 19-MNA-CIBAN-0066 TaxID=3140422 RepID=UPI003319D81E